MITVNTDLLSVTSGVIAHQVNCLGVMGTGVALAIRNKFPVVYELYRNAFNQKQWALGKIQMIEVGDGLWVCNLAGQFRFGRDKRYTEYPAVTIGFIKLKAWCDNHGVNEVHIPYKMGCANAGGDWDEYLAAIRDSELEADGKITLIAHDITGGEGK